MNLTKKLGLNICGHQDIDFIDINLETDVELYVDPTLIDGLATSWCQETQKIIAGFFKNVFESCEKKDYQRLYQLVGCGREPNETKLGLSVEQSRGRGSKPESLYQLFRSISDNQYIEKGIVKNPADICVYVNNFAEDRMSDLITNIIRKQLYKFTVQQCTKHSISLSTKPCILGYYWDLDAERWETLQGPPLLINDRKTLLVPKIIVRRKFIISVAQYIQKHILAQRQAFHLENRTSLSHLKYSKKKGFYRVAPSKKEVYAKEIKGQDHKRFAREYAEQNPEITDEFRRRQVLDRNIWDYVLSDGELDRYVYGKRRKSA